MRPRSQFWSDSVQLSWCDGPVNQMLAGKEARQEEMAGADREEKKKEEEKGEKKRREKGEVKTYVQ